MKNINFKLKNTVLMLAAAVLFTANAPGQEKTFVGESLPLGNGTVRSWVTLNKRDLSAIGITFGEDALKNLPTEPPPGREGTEYVLGLPPEAANTVFKHILVNWNARPWTDEDL